MLHVVRAQAQATTLFELGVDEPIKQYPGQVQVARAVICCILTPRDGHTLAID